MGIVIWPAMSARAILMLTIVITILDQLLVLGDHGGGILDLLLHPRMTFHLVTKTIVLKAALTLGLVTSIVTECARTLNVGLTQGIVVSKIYSQA